MKAYVQGRGSVIQWLETLGMEYGKWPKDHARGSPPEEWKTNRRQQL